MRGKIVLAMLAMIGALAALGFWFWRQNSFSTGTLKLEILAPGEITMGEEITYVVKYKNVGEIELENAILVFEYPEGALPSEGSETRITKSIDDINPGQEASMRFAARLFGKENEVKEAKAFVSYTPRNLSASFQSETSATSQISFVPVNFELDIPSKMEAGQQFDITLNYFSNSEYPLSDLRIQMDYPGGFEFRNANPAPLGENEWNIGVLNRTEGGRITIRGALGGDVDEVKLFKAVFGSWKEGRFTVLSETTKAVQITKPRLLISQTVNGRQGAAVSAGDSLHYEVFFKNPSDRILENLFLIVTLEGRAFDANSVKAEGGKVQRGDNSILWEAKDAPKLRFLGRGEEGRVEFWVNVKDDIEVFSPQDKELVLKNRVLVSEASEEFELKLKADLVVEQRGFFQDEVFGNQGTHPPVVGQRNTYTITWQASNRYNDVNDVRVKATLPLGVELTGKIFPEDSALTFDSASREIVWEAGDLAAGTGVLEELGAPSVAFQIGFTPNALHRGRAAQLIGEARISGEDTFLGETISFADLAVDTTLPDDPSVTPALGAVQ